MNSLRELIEAAGHHDVFQVPELRAAGDDEIAGTFSNPSGGFISAIGGGPSHSGVHVTPDLTMQISAAYACVRIISETVASLPRHTFRRTANGRMVERNHPVSKLLARPNDWQSPMEFFEAITAQVCLTGNGYARVWRSRGVPVRMVPMHPNEVDVRESPVDGGPDYFFRSKDGETALRRDEVLHVRGLALSAKMLKGISPVAYHRETLGIAAVMERYSARTFGSGLSTRAWIEEPRKLDPEIAAIRRAAFQSAYGGAYNAGGVAIMDAGSKLHAIDLSPKDKEYLLSRKFQIAEIARIWRMQLHKLGELDKATFSNIEQQSIEHVVDTLRPWLVRWEQAMHRTLLDGSPDMYIEHAVEGLLRGDIKSRYEAYAIARNWGWYSADDIRELENRNPLPDGIGEEYLRPMNMTLAGSSAEPS